MGSLEGGPSWPVLDEHCFAIERSQLDDFPVIKLGLGEEEFEIVVGPEIGIR
jgi:hypothetical protein